MNDTYSKSWEDFLEGRKLASDFRGFRLELTLLIQQHRSLRSAPFLRLYVIETIHCFTRISYHGKIGSHECSQTQGACQSLTTIAFGWTIASQLSVLTISKQSLHYCSQGVVETALLGRPTSSQFCVPYVITHPIVWQVLVMNGNLCFATGSFPNCWFGLQLRCWAEKLSQLLGGHGVSHIDVRYAHPVQQSKDRRSLVCLTVLHVELGSGDKLYTVFDVYNLHMFRKLTI